MLAIVTTHPIQYQVPLWQLLARDGRLPFQVWYLTEHATRPSRDREFGQTFAWDLDMLAGYPHRFVAAPPDATPNSFWKCRFAEPISDLLRAHEVTAVWVQGWQVAAYWQAVWAADSLGLEVWLRGESNDLRALPVWKRAAKRVVLRQFFRRVDRFLCIGSANRRLYQSFGISDECLYNAPYAVDNERFARQASALRSHRSEIRTHWKIPDDAFCVLFCGKFIRKKRPVDLLEAARSVVTHHSSLKLHLLFVGSGELGAELRASCNVLFDADAPDSSLITRHSSLPDASFAGFLNQTEISRAYVAADVLVLPSDYEETWGLVVNEAMASGLPCIVSDHCGCAEDLGTSPGNAVYPCGDVSSLANNIEGFLHNRTAAIQPPPDLEKTAVLVELLAGTR